MTLSRKQQAKVEEYSRALLDASRAEGRAYSDLTQWRHAVKFSPEVMDTLTSMQEEDDVDLIDEVYAEFKRLVDSDDSIVSVTVTTAVPLDDELRQKVCERAEDMFHASIYLVERVEPKILGGIILEAQGQRFDASVKTQLATVRRTLSNAFMGGDE
jgi:F-type H+-transporting ATPase subunit delta